MKGKNRVSMEDLHQPQQQLFVKFLAGMNLIFLVFLVFHFVDLDSNRQISLYMFILFPITHFFFLLSRLFFNLIVVLINHYLMLFGLFLLSLIYSFIPLYID